MEKNVEIRRRAALAAPGDPEIRRSLARALAQAGRGAEALGELREASTLAPLPPDAEALRRELFAAGVPLRGAPLAAAIGEALGLPEPYAEPEDPALDTFHLHAGAVCPRTGRVAWVEETQRDSGGGLMDCALQLKVTEAERALVWWDLATYNPYFGCTLVHLGWIGEQVFVVYREKHRTLAALVGREHAQLADAGRTHVLLDDQLWSHSLERGLLDALSLPGFERRVPLPVPIGPAFPRLALTLDGEVLQVGETRVRLPSPAQRRLAPQGSLRASITRAVFGDSPPQPLADLLVGAVTWPFWLEREPAARTHYAHRGIAWAPPVWLPAYWVRHLERVDEAGARAALERIEALGREADVPRGWDPSWDPLEGAVRLARNHLARSCQRLAEVCRTGVLPEPTASCSFWNDGPRAAFRAAQGRFPRGLQQVFEVLDRDPPRPFARP